MQVQVSGTLRLSLPESIDVFISARFDGGVKEKKARELYEALKKRNKLKPFMVDAGAGDDFGNWTDRSLHRMKAMVAICFEDYGQKTENPYCTFTEVRSARNQGKPIIPVRLCQEWPPKPKDYDGKDLGAAQNSAVFDLGVGYGSDWSSKKWKADECAKEVEDAFFKKFGKSVSFQPQPKPQSQPLEVQSVIATDVVFDLSIHEIQKLPAKKSKRSMSKKKKKWIFLLITFLIVAGTAIGLSLAFLLKESKITTILNGEGIQDLFGSAIATSSDGGTVVIGSPETNDIVSKGYVKVYSFDVDSWQLKGEELIGQSVGDEFGKSVSISYNGTVVAIGSPNYTSGTGQVQVYSFADSSWQPMSDTINGDSTTDYFGTSVSLSSDGLTIAIGAPANGALSGYVKVLTFYKSTWIPKGDIISIDATYYFGKTLVLRSDGDALAIGCSVNSAEMTGLVFIYSFTDGVGWKRTFGRQLTSAPISLSNQKGVVAAGIDGEVVFIFGGRGSIFDVHPNHNFGSSISLSSDGDTIAIGAPNAIDSTSGKVEVYSYDGSTWNLKGNAIQGQIPGDSFGYSVSLSSAGDRVAVGAPTNSVNGTDSGEVRIYSFDGSTWELM